MDEMTRHSHYQNKIIEEKVNFLESYLLGVTDIAEIRGPYTLA